MPLDLNHIPKLGFGLMRLPEKGGKIDIERACSMVDAYLAKGFCYFDTAYMYHQGQSECAVKQLLVDRYPRDAFFLATKLPPWNVHSFEDRDRLFEEQLAKTGAGYFDFYLLHSLEDGMTYDTFEKWDCFTWAIKKKTEGKIRHFGFSFHGTPQLLEKVLNAHPEVEFVQIQLNYADWNNPVIRSGELYNILHSRNIPVFVMEPNKGGMLARLEPELEQILKRVHPQASPASWAMRFVASLEGVAIVLSGMSDENQMRDNLNTFSDFMPMTELEYAAVRKVVERIFDMALIQCTSCRYCCGNCPQSIPIPDLFRCMNSYRLHSKDIRSLLFYKSITSDSGKAEDCIACGQCESVCPQHLNIIELLRDTANTFDK